MLLWVSVSLAIGAVAVSAPMAVVVLNPTSAPPGRLPEGWQLKVNHGAPDLAAIGEGGSRVLRFKSHKSSFALERGVDVDVSQYPLLTWSWKVSQLPAGGDFRHSATDDQAAQVLVAFADRHVLAYIWDSSAPKGSWQSASSVPLLHIFALVCRSGRDELNQWLPETHNLAQDYQKAFERPPTRVKGIRLQINSQHTGTSAESYFGDVSFRTAQ
jgi:Protein of unknown function (DUF3047)